MNITRLFQIDQKIRSKNLECTIAGKENKEWRKYSGKEFSELTDSIAYGLITLGLKPGDVISVISSNRPEWMLVDFGVIKFTGINAPIYPNINREEYDYILNDCKSKIIFVENKEIYDKILPVIQESSFIKDVYSFDKIEGVKHLSELIELGNKNPQSSYVKAWQVEAKSSDVFTIIYTSGTTGNPKGVLLSHSNFIHQIVSLNKYFPLNENNASLSFLPLCHVFQRFFDYYMLYYLTPIYFAESIEKIGENLKETKPTIFCTVPRLLEKVYDKIVFKGTQLTGIKKSLFFWALNLAKEYEFEGKSSWYKLQLKLANKLIFSKWREALGNEVKYVIVGAASLQPKLARVFTAAQIPVFEGYGMSETSPAMSINTVGKGSRFGTVGKVIPKGEFKLLEDGEICFRGPNVMLGYLNAEQATKETIVDGWIHTGDIGELSEDGFLKITDRKKEMFKTSGGKYISPQCVENKMKESRFVEQIMVVGDGHKFPAALVVPNKDFLINWCKIKEIKETDISKIVELPRVKDRIWKEIDNLNSSFANYTQIKKIVVLGDEWTIKNKILTPTQKLKRKRIMQEYKEVIENIYKN